MKNLIKTKLAALALAVTAVVPSLHAQLTLPTTDVSDGVLNITVSTNIDLSKAVTVSSWTNTSPSPGLGVYDATQWAVVFKYSSIYIASNATVTFVNHITHAPVVWVVNGNVTINGTINLDGQSSTTDPNILPEPGPGGFRGGGGPNGGGPGFGPGGGVGAYNLPGYFGSYGNPQILPLIGGSGGSGYGSQNGGAGGGAILIAATGNINLTNCNLHAIGGVGNNGYNCGSGGGIRLVGSQISGNSSSFIQAAAGGSYNAPGRIRLEANTLIGSINLNPTTAGALPDNPLVKIFPDTNAPTVTILSVAGITTGLTDPKAIMSSGVNADDVTLVTTNAVTIQLQTRNFPTNGTVSVYIHPRNSFPPQSPLTATFVSGNTNSALWQVSTTELYPGQAAHTVIQARASF